jgi:hypothetical protein
MTNQTDRELLARRFLDDHGLKIEVEYQAANRYQATIHRGHKSFGLTLPADNLAGHLKPTAYDALTTLLIRGAMKPDFERRIRTFFGERELREMAEIV